MPETTSPSQYATAAELGLYALSATALGSATTGEQNSFLQAASGFLESYFSGRYDLPLTTYGVDVVMATTAIAGYLLVKQHGFNLNSEEGKNIRQGYEDAVAWLRDVASGKATPSVATTIDSAPTPAAAEKTFAVAPSTGSISARPSSFRESSSDADVPVGTVGTPRLRGW